MDINLAKHSLNYIFTSGLIQGIAYGISKITLSDGHQQVNFLRFCNNCNSEAFKRIFSYPAHNLIINNEIQSTIYIFGMPNSDMTFNIMRLRISDAVFESIMLNSLTHNFYVLFLMNLWIS